VKTPQVREEIKRMFLAVLKIVRAKKIYDIIN
jgi:hypothetical protein